MAILPGRAFTRRLYMLTRGNNLKPHHHTRLTKKVKGDLALWLEFLNHPTVFARPFMDLSKVLTAEDIDMYSDASANPDLGCGGHSQNEWFYYQWDREFIIEQQPSIEFLELYGVTMSILLWIHKYKNKRICLFCDNLGVVYMLNKNTSHSRRCMVLIRYIVLYAMIFNVRVFAKHVTTKNNYLADHLSRLRIEQFKQEAASIKYVDTHPQPIPHELLCMRQLWYQA